MPILSFDIGLTENKELKSTSVMTVDGSVKIFSREKTDEAKIMTADTNDQMTAEEKGLYKMLSAGFGPKALNTYQYHQRGVWGVPEHFSFKVEKPKYHKLKAYDKHLRKFQYDLALMAALKTDDSTIILSVLEEFLIRDCLEITIKQLEANQLKLLANFLLKKSDSMNCQRLILHVLDIFLEVISPSVLEDSSLDRILSLLYNKVEQEIRNAERSCYIQSYLD